MSDGSGGSRSMRAASLVVLRRRRGALAMQTMTASTWVASGSVGDDGVDGGEARSGGGFQVSSGRVATAVLELGRVHGKVRESEVEWMVGSGGV